MEAVVGGSSATDTLIASNAINAWTLTVRLASNFKSTKNPLNTQPNAGIYFSGGTTGGMRSAFGSKHPGGANFLWTDGHVSWITNSINFNLYKALGTRNGGEVASGDF